MLAEPYEVGIVHELCSFQWRVVVIALLEEQFIFINEGTITRPICVCGVASQQLDWRLNFVIGRDSIVHSGLNGILS